MLAARREDLAGRQRPATAGIDKKVSAIPGSAESNNPYALHL
jgi:hypothetical protein